MIYRPGELWIEIDRDHDYGPVLVVGGEIDVCTAPGLARALTETATERPRRLLVDLSDVSHIGSAGLHVLLDASAAWPETLFAVIATAPTSRFMHALGIDTQIAVYPHQAMALACTGAAVAPAEL